MTTALNTFVRPIRDQIVVRRADPIDKTKGGIILADNAKEKPTRGTVFAVGSGHLQNGIQTPLEIEDGDEVLFREYAGTNVTIEGEDFTVLREADVLAVLSQR